MTASAKLDVKKSDDTYRARRGEFRVIEVPERRYLMIDGHGDPNTSSDFTDALAALYPVAYKTKFASARRLGRDYVVPPLEGLWWSDDMDTFTVARDKSRWSWTLMLLVPDWVPEEFVDESIATVGSSDPPRRLADVRVEALAEGLCIQTLHVGAFDDEAAVLARLHDDVIPSRGMRMTGRHHEIYLSDRRRVAPEKMRTILRQPVAREP